MDMEVEVDVESNHCVYAMSERGSEREQPLAENRSSEKENRRAATKIAQLPRQHSASSRPRELASLICDMAKSATISLKSNRFKMPQRPWRQNRGNSSIWIWKEVHRAGRRQKAGGHIRNTFAILCICIWQILYLPTGGDCLLAAGFWLLALTD